MKKFRKLVLLLWKNYLMQKKQPFYTLIEILLPLAISFLLVALRFYVETEKVEYPTKFSEFSLKDCLESSLLMSKPWHIAWSPNSSTVARRIMEQTNFYRVLNKGFHPDIYLNEFSNEHEMETMFLQGNNTKVVLVGISFDDSLSQSNQNQSSFPENLLVRIRFPGLSRFVDNQSTTFDTQFPNWKTHVPFPLYQPFGPRDAYSVFGGQPGYCKEGFISVQHAIFESIFQIYKEEFNASMNLPDFKFQRFPYPPFVQDRLLPALISFISIFIIFSYTYSAIRTIKLVTVEKETKMKEVMKLMGLGSWMHWTAWLLKEFIQWLILSCLITLALTLEWTNGCVIKNTNPVIVLLILLTYSFSSICFCFLISSCFNKANSAATVGVALWFLSYSPYLIYQPTYESMSWFQIVSWSFLCNTNLGYIFQMIVMYEGTGTGIQWDNLFIPVSPSDKVSPGELIIYLFSAAIVYLTVAVYIEEAFPGTYGMPKPWYFPFQASYWCGYKKNTSHHQVMKGIQIRDLTKIYSTGKMAVKQLTLDMYPNQITVLLGHNGAGKSSSMSMLIGLIRPTSGTATINGYDIWSDMDKIRESLGLCPQFDLLFEELTVEEHLIFFGKLKGCYGNDLRNEIQKYVSKLEMTSKLHCRAGGLSGGYKRKLSVAIALVGHSEVVLLDEPTSRMDPTARRCLWDLLQEERKGRTIMMTTHLMDEADLLGDRVAILNSGQLKCVGTPFMLKKKFGYGYTLSLVKKTPDVNVEKISMFLGTFNNKTQLMSDMETEIKYKLGDSDTISSLLNALTERQLDLGVKEYGISLTTLEDVYMRVVNSDDFENEKIDTIIRTSICGKVTNGRVDLPSSLKPTSSCGINTRVKWRKQFIAMIQKKYIISKKSWFLHFIQILTTLLFLMIANAVTEAWRGSVDLPPLNLTLKNYRKPIIITGLGKDNGSKAIYESLDLTVRKESSEIIRFNGFDFDRFILNEYRGKLEIVNSAYIFGAEVQNSTNQTLINIHFNNQPFHSFPTSLAVMQNSIIKTISGFNRSVTFINKPLPYIPEEKIKKLEGGSNFGFQVGFNTGFAQAFICATFLVLLMRELETGAKHLQFISGVKPSIYWSASVLWDCSMYFLSMFTMIAFLYYHQDAAFSDYEQLGQVIVLLLSYVWAIIPLMNLASYLFTKPSIAFMKTSLIGVLTGCSVFVIVLILEIRPLFLIEEAKNIETIMTWFPHYTLCQGLRNIYLNHGQKALYENKGSQYPGNYAWEKPGIGKNIFTLILIGFIINIVLLCLENVKHKVKKLNNIIYKYWTHLRKNPGMEHELKTYPSFDDTDVTSEKHIVEMSSKLDYIVIMKNVSKKYGNFTAVKSLNLALHSHECFALLGSNGAGKTTTFKMLTTKIDITSGSIDICSMDIVRERSKVRKVIGYCPQQDALFEKLTGRETLKMYCTLRGIPTDEHNLVITQLSERLVFYKFLDVEAGNYSGGNQRKLSTAIAMIGDPPVILLDEPTSGMDPEARRHLWDVLKEERDRGKCIIITTHSLEECEVLCTRLAIMVEGEIRCIGSVQHLKNKFASGYKLHVKFPPHSQQNVKWIISASLSGSSVHEEFEGMILFHIPSNISCSSVFSTMEKAKSDALIEDYSIQQTSLEQVFTKVTKKLP